MDIRECVCGITDENRNEELHIGEMLEQKKENRQIKY